MSVEMKKNTERYFRSNCYCSIVKYEEQTFNRKGLLRKLFLQNTREIKRKFRCNILIHPHFTVQIRDIYTYGILVGVHPWGCPVYHLACSRQPRGCTGMRQTYSFGLGGVVEYCASQNAIPDRAHSSMTFVLWTTFCLHHRQNTPTQKRMQL